MITTLVLAFSAASAASSSAAWATSAALWKRGVAAEVADDLGVEAALADAGVGDVDDGVAHGVEGGDGGAGGDGLAGADLAGDHADGVLCEPGDAGDGFGVAAVGVEHAGGQVAPKGGAAKTVVGAEPLDHKAPSIAVVSTPSIAAVSTVAASVGSMLVLGLVAVPSGAGWSGVMVAGRCNWMPSGPT
jgi:hypothetical protein